MHAQATRIAGALLAVAALGVLGPRAFAGDLASGRTYFMRYCASCHGVEADGHGYVARALAHPPSDLRHLAERFGAPLKAERIARYIDGREDVIAHGARDMPVWGEAFVDIEAHGTAREQIVHDRIAAIVAYLGSIQAKTQK